MRGRYLQRNESWLEQSTVFTGRGQYTVSALLLMSYSVYVPKIMNVG